MSLTRLDVRLSSEPSTWLTSRERLPDIVADRNVLLDGTTAVLLDVDPSSPRLGRTPTTTTVTGTMRAAEHGDLYS